MNIPQDVAYLLEQLSPHETYLVGGCVRDDLLGLPVHDYDICTSLLPQEVKAILCVPVLETGIKHGTVTAILHGKPYEITTFRTEGAYSDGRRPDQVSFTRSIEEDLSRRDFTINAMAYHPAKGLIDPFGGKNDLERGIIRAVGNPYERMKEDALRILRGIRFASRLSFQIEDETKNAMLSLKDRLSIISVERIYQELIGFLKGEDVLSVSLEFEEILFSVLPCLKAMKGFEQHNIHHQYDVWNHTLHAVSEGDSLIVRLTMLFHDVGKPNTFLWKDGQGHFYGHAKESAKIATQALESLKADRKTIDTVKLLIEYHDYPVVLEEKAVSRLVSRIGKENFRYLLSVKRADSKALASQFVQERFEILAKWEGIFNELERKNACFSLKELKINGNDLMKLGLVGREIGSVLNQLLELVLDEKIENDREKLLNFIMNKQKG